MSGQTWTWTRGTFEFAGATYITYSGESQYHRAIVTNWPSGDRWQGTIPLSGQLDQRSPYYRSAAPAKAWCERYGQPRTTRTHARQETHS